MSPIAPIRFFFQCFILFLAFFAASRAHGQETVFDIPSADVLDRGKVYGELDGTARPANAFFTFTPRVVAGLGGGIEAGVNFNGLSSPTIGQLDISPTIKWRVWNRKTSGWSFYVGDDLFFPVRDRTYDAGNSFYAAFAKQWTEGTRITFGGYDFTKNVVAAANRAGGQFTLEQQLGHGLTLAAEWYTGKQADGYVNSGAMIKLTSKLTLYAAYQVGNAGVSMGNHQFLWELGYNFN
ncbi:MAG: hypothetical protein WCD49_09825 [Candidatus Acidiferrales bacterium]